MSVSGKKCTSVPRLSVSPVMRMGDTSSVRATFSHSRRTADTPNAVLISMGHSEQMKITNIDEVALSLIVYSASGIQASGEIGFSTWMKGSNAR